MLLNLFNYLLIVLLLDKITFNYTRMLTTVNNTNVEGKQYTATVSNTAMTHTG